MFLFWLKHKNDECYISDNRCEDCNLQDICFYEPWFCKIWYKISTVVYNSGEIFKSIVQNILKKKYVCSKCGLIEVPSGKYAAICESYGWRKNSGMWVCHHCDAHYNDCVKLDKDGNHVEISQEEFNKNWYEHVIDNNKKYE